MKIAITLFIILLYSSIFAEYSECREMFNRGENVETTIDCFNSAINNTKNKIIIIDSARYITSLCSKEISNNNNPSFCTFNQSIEAFKKVQDDKGHLLYYEAKYYDALSYYYQGIKEKDKKKLNLSLEYATNVIENKNKLVGTTPYLIKMTIANTYMGKAKIEKEYNYYTDAIRMLEESEKETKERKYQIAIEKIKFNAKKAFADQIVISCGKNNENNSCNRCNEAKKIYQELTNKANYKNVSQALKKDIAPEYNKSVCEKNPKK